MVTLFLALVLALAPAGPVRGGQEPETFRVPVARHAEVYRLAREFRLTVLDACDDAIIVLADVETIGRLRAAGYRPEPVPPAPEAAVGTYHTFAEACSVLAALAATYPAIARLDTIGLASDNRPIPALLVTRDPDVPAPRPVVRLVGAHHGNEKPSTEIVLHIAGYLCEEYGADPLVTRLVDSREFRLIPVLNPDGHDRNRRTNANGADLNRDYGYEWETYSAPFTQPESRALRALSERRIPTIEYEYHTTASYVNYLWDNHPADPPDSAWVLALARRYADSTYGSPITELRPINGFSWYEVHGSCQDYMFGIYGCFAYTIETRRPSTREPVDSICVANRRAVLDMALLAGWGVSGIVTDSLTQSPLAARVEVLSPERWHTFSNADVGDFHRVLAPGRYDLRVSANGYLPRTLTGVIVPDTGGARLDVRLLPAPPDAPAHARRAVTLKRIDNNHTWSDWYLEALGPPDGGFYTLGNATGEIVFELSPAMVNGDGNDLTVHAEGSYSVSAGLEWLGPWYALGTGSGTAWFDLAVPGLDSARYLLVRNLSGARLDAVSYRSPRTGQAEPGPGPGLALSIRPNPARSFVRLDFGPLRGAPGTVSLHDAAGRLVRRFAAPGGADITLTDAAGRPLADGVYFCRVEVGGRSRVAKLVVRR